MKKSIGNRNIGQHFSREKAIEITLASEKNEYETVGLGESLIKYKGNKNDLYCKSVYLL